MKNKLRRCAAIFLTLSFFAPAAALVQAQNIEEIGATVGATFTNVIALAA